MNLQDRCADLVEMVGQGWSRKSVSSPQAARTPLVVDYGTGAAGRMSRGLPTRRGLQTLALIIATAYATILLYQAVAPRQVIGVIVIILYRHYCTLLRARARALVEVVSLGDLQQVLFLNCSLFI